MSELLKYVVKRTSLNSKSIENTVTLLSQDCTLPFIARYRKETTGGLDEVEIGKIIELKDQFEAFEKRKKSILKALEEQNVLTSQLKDEIEKTQDLTILEDLYLPYKKKRKTKAETARNNGLEPLAKIIMSQNAQDPERLAQRYLNSKVPDAQSALEGARHIIAEWINERTDLRNNLRRQLARHAVIETKVVKTKAKDEKAQKFRDYFDWSEALSRCPSHRLLAILRAENEGFIRTKITVDDERALEQIERSVLARSQGRSEPAHSQGRSEPAHSQGRNALRPICCQQQIKLAIKDAYKRLLLPALSNEALSDAKKKADATAITVFAKNLRQLLLGSPLGEKRTLALDPGFRTGCKLVCLDAQGKLLHNETIYPHAPKNDDKGAIKKISSLSDAYKIEAIAIGNGTASRETERLIRRIHFKNPIEVFIVSEAGASIYSASKIARDEFPNYDVTVRGAVSIGRRLQDPLAELVKIDAKSIGVGQYQHDVDQTALQKSLDQTVENCVNAVGVNINTASAPLLSYVSGIGPKLAEGVVRFRESEGPFKTRQEIKNVPRLGEKAFVQAAGFLRITVAKNPLDNSSVHPERYKLVTNIAKDQKVSIAKMIGNTSLLKSIDLKKYVTQDVGLPTLTDILSELEKPGLDIRKKTKVFTFNQNIRTIEDLEPGQLLPGIVNNVTAFGAFVDIGIKESGLIHISNLADGFVSDVNAHISLQQQVIVKVLEVDIARKRIQLKLKN